MLHIILQEIRNEGYRNFRKTQDKNFSVQIEKPVR